jgi:hypothetical protein
MSSRCMAAVFERYPAGGGEFALALALADNAHDDGTHIFPTVSTMAHKSRQTTRSVQIHLQAMREAGWLILVKPAGGRSRPAEYRINPAWLKGEDISPFTAVDNSPEKAEKGEKRASKRVKSTTQKGEICDVPIRTIGTVIQNTPLPPACGGDCGLNALATEYPALRVDLEAAEERWRKLAPDAQLQATMLAEVKRQARTPEWQREEGRYAPKLSKWLRNKRWRKVEQAAPSPLPTVAVAPALTREQLAANKARADALVARVRGLARRQPLEAAA